MYILMIELKDKSGRPSLTLLFWVEDRAYVATIATLSSRDFFIRLKEIGIATE